MLKPEQIKAHRFNTVTRGTYEADSVDAFFAEVSASYEQMFRENGELVKKISLLAERVSQYKNDEDNIRRALLTAERMADKIQRDAQQAAQEHMENAEKKAAEIVTAAQNRAEVVETAASVNASRLTEESQKAASERLTNAERTATILITDAERKSAEIIENGKSQAQAELDRITADIKANSAALNILSDEVTRFKSSLLEVYREHIELITSLPKKGEEFVAEEAAKEDKVTEIPVAEIPAVADVPAAEEPAVEEIPVEPVVEEVEVQVDDFKEEVSEEIGASDNAERVEPIIKEELALSAEELEVYNPLDTALTSDKEEAADVPAAEEPAVEKEIIEAVTEEPNDERDNYLKGFVIDLSEIENTIVEEEQAPEAPVAEPQIPQTLSDNKKDNDTYSKFRGFFKK